jgi:hypothetical protein
LTAVTGEFFYLGGQATLKKFRQNPNVTLDYEENKEWMKLLNVSFSKKSLFLDPSQTGDFHKQYCDKKIKQY